MSRRVVLCCAGAILLRVLTGCSTTSLFKRGWSEFPHAGPRNPVIKVVALWQPGEGTGADGKLCRGFVGQIYFFTPQSHLPAIADGAARIYVFDDHGTTEERVKPIRQFDFSVETWQGLAQNGKLGPTYVTFIPYTRKGCHEAHCTLRVQLTPKQGPPVFSEMANVVLPGVKSKPEVAGTALQRVRGGVASKSLRSNSRADSVEDLIAAMNRSTPNAKRPAAVPLTTLERERILRETRDKLARDVRLPEKPADQSDEIDPSVGGRNRRLPQDNLYGADLAG